MINERKLLGKILRITLGKGGYDDAMFGVSIMFSSGEGTHVNTFIGHWRGERSKTAKWTDESRLVEQGKLMMRIDEMCRLAKVDYFHELAGVPVEFYFEGNRLKDWRILTEVI